MQSVYEVKNVKPFSDTHTWTLLTDSCIAVSTLFNVFPRTHKAKSSTNKGAICTLHSFNDVVNLDAE